MPTPPDTIPSRTTDLRDQEPDREDRPLLHPDSELRDAICAGDARAQEDLLVRRCGRLLGWLSDQYGHPDLPGELFLHLSHENWRRLRTWAGRSSLKTWVEHVAIRLCLRHVKETRRFRPLEEWDELEEASTRDRNEQEERFSRRDLLKAVAMLKSDQERRLLTLHALHGMPIADTARLMGITRGNADVIKCRAIRHIREKLGLEGGRDA